MKISSRSPEDALTDTSRNVNRTTSQDNPLNLHCRISIVRPGLPGMLFRGDYLAIVDVPFSGLRFRRYPGFPMGYPLHADPLSGGLFYPKIILNVCVQSD